MHRTGNLSTFLDFKPPKLKLRTQTFIVNGSLNSDSSRRSKSPNMLNKIACFENSKLGLKTAENSETDLKIKDNK